MKIRKKKTKAAKGKLSKPELKQVVGGVGSKKRAKKKTTTRGKPF